MEYKIIHTRETDNYTRYLKELSEKGFRVISAGMTANPALKCFDWWAILEEARADIEAKKPEDEAAELLEAARKIAGYCERNGGKCWGTNGKCPMFNESIMRCRAACVSKSDTAPKYWCITKEE